MSNRVMALTVVLDRELGEERAARVSQYVAEQRVRMELVQKIYGLLQ